MLQISHSLESSLLVRDVTGDYRPANADEVLQAAQQVLAGQMRGCEALTSPQMVRDFLRVKLGTLEHEVFAVIHLDAQNRIIDYVEMFRGTVSQISAHLLRNYYCFLKFPEQCQLGSADIQIANRFLRCFGKSRYLSTRN